MRRIAGLALIWTAIAVAIQSVISPNGQCAPTAKPSDQLTIQVGGITRTYRLHLPPTYDGTTAFPLVLIFHGRSEGAKDIVEITRFNQAADEQGFLAVYPVGIHQHWNDGRTVTPIFGAGNYDDVGFIKALIDSLQRTFAIDPSRIYATGMSNGGMFVQRLACELDGTFAAIAPVSGTLAQDIAPRCTPKTPVSVLEFHGTKDAYIHWDGGTARAIGGKTLSVERTITHWQQQDGCPHDVVIDYVPMHAPNDPTRVRRERYSACRGGSEVVLYAIEGGGHIWPGGPADHSLPFLGRVTQQISATDAIAAFFRQHPKFVQGPLGVPLFDGKTGSVLGPTPAPVPSLVPLQPSVPLLTPIHGPSAKLNTSLYLALLRSSLNLPLTASDALIKFTFSANQPYQGDPTQ